MPAAQRRAPATAGRQTTTTASRPVRRRRLRCRDVRLERRDAEPARGRARSLRRPVLRRPAAGRDGRPGGAVAHPARPGPAAPAAPRRVPAAHRQPARRRPGRGRGDVPSVPGVRRRHRHRARGRPGRVHGRQRPARNGPGHRQSGGWTLSVAYEDTNQPTRNLTIFDGFRFVLADGPPVDIPLSGFVTPRTGTVSTRIGLAAIEGDLGTTGDSATVNAGTPAARVLQNASNPANNFFNASISARDGTPFTLRRPNDVNQFGYDADVVDATGFLANGQSATTIRLATSGDGFAPQAVSFATDLFAPSLRVVKAVDRDSARLGDVLTYTVGVSNAGLDAATNVTLRDVIPAGTAYEPNSLAIGGVPQTDRAGDDEAEFDAAGNAVVLRVGAGASATSGGRLAVGAPPVSVR